MIPVYVKRKMRMTKTTYTALKMAGFIVIPLDSNIRSINDGILWNWGWYGGELSAPILLNDPVYIGETSVRGCFDICGDIMPPSSLHPEHQGSGIRTIGKSNGMKGRNKEVFVNDNIRLGYSLYQMFIEPPREEYRALMVRNKRIVSYRKIIDNAYNPMCDKIFKMCGGRRSREEPLPKQARKLAREAMKRTKLDILGLDIIVDSDGKAWLTEANSAPGIGPYSALRLMEFIQRGYTEGFFNRGGVSDE